MTILDTLTPERYVQELPFLLENLALEFPQLRMTIDPENLLLVAQDMAAGMRDRGRARGDERLPCAIDLETRARSGLPAQILMSSDMVMRFAADISRGTELRLTGPSRENPAIAD